MKRLSMLEFVGCGAIARFIIDCLDVQVNRFFWALLLYGSIVAVATALKGE